MQKVISIRMNKSDLDFVKETAREEQAERSKVIREIIEKGRLYLAIEQYRQGKISIGKAAEKANKNISEMIDLLAGLGIKSPITKQQYLESAKNLDKVWRQRKTTQ